MAGVYTGDFADAKLIHPLDTEDGDVIGPTAYTLRNGATIEAAPSQFGSSLLCDANFERLDSDVAVAGIDQSDTAKMMFHFWWRTTTLAAQQGHITWINSAGTLFKMRVFWNTGTQEVRAEWVRATDLSPGNPAISVNSFSGRFSTGVFAAISAYINAAGASEGKIFKDGVDITNTVVEAAAATRGTSGFDFLRIGNHFNGLDPARFIDHATIIQSASLSDAKAVLLSTNYHDTRGFGYNPTFTSTNITDVVPGSAVIITGSGFGRDVTITVDGIAAVNVSRLSESSVSFRVPFGISSGLLNLGIKNVASNVTFTEFNALNNKVTPWTASGGSTRIIRFGDGLVSGVAKVGDPVPFCDPNIFITTWTRISRAPD